MRIICRRVLRTVVITTVKPAYIEAAYSGILDSTNKFSRICVICMGITNISILGTTNTFSKKELKFCGWFVVNFRTCLLANSNFEVATQIGGVQLHNLAKLPNLRRLFDGHSDFVSISKSSVKSQNCHINMKLCHAPTLQSCSRNLIACAHV